MQLSKKQRNVGVAIVVAIVGISIVFGWGVYRNTPTNIIKTTVEWTGMGSLPDSASVLETSASGAPFSRDLTVKFTAEDQVLELWLQQNSNRIYDATEVDNVVTRYYIHPIEGVTYAEMLVDDVNDVVIVHVYKE